MENGTGAAYRAAAMVVPPVLRAATRRVWSGGEHVPKTGGCIVAVNHISHLDPLAFAHFLHAQGRTVHFLAKSGLFTVPVFGRFLRSAGQIPIERERRSAGDALDAASAAIENGSCVVIYPEGTITRDPDLWPMVGRSGVARIALGTGCEVIPAAQWGAHEILPPYTALPRLVPRKTIRVTADPPVDLSAYRNVEPTPAVLRQGTATIIDAITGLLAGLREEPATSERFDPRTAGLPAHGNFRKKRKKG